MEPLLAWTLTHFYNTPSPGAPRTLAVQQDDVPNFSRWFVAIAGDGAIAKLSKLAAAVNTQQLLWAMQPGNPQPIAPLSLITDMLGASLLGGVFVVRSKELPPPEHFRTTLKTVLARHAPTTVADAVLTGEVIPANLRTFLANKGVVVLVGPQARALKRLFIPQSTACYQALTSVNGNPRAGLLSMAFSRNTETATFVQRQLADFPFILVKHARIHDVLDFQNSFALSKLVKLLRMTCGIVIDLPDDDIDAAESRTTDLGLFWITPQSFLVQQAVIVAASQPRCVSAQDRAVARGAAWIQRPLHHFEVQDAVAHSRELQRRAAVGVALPSDPFAQSACA